MIRLCQNVVVVVVVAAAGVVVVFVFLFASCYHLLRSTAGQSEAGLHTYLLHCV